MRQLDGHRVSREMGITPDEIRRRFAWLEFNQEDEARIVSLREMADAHGDEVIEDLYRHFLAFPEVKAFFDDPEVLDHVKSMQRDYFMRLMRGGYDEDYIEDRLNIGAVHERVGVDVKWYLGAYNHYIRFIGKKVFDMHPGNPAEALRTLESLQKLIYLDIGLAIDTYVFKRERTILAQQEAIREISTPVLQIREGMLLLPIVGAIDSQRAKQITSNLLARIRENRAHVVVIDVTGVPGMDSMVANHLIQTVEAARLMGARTILAGLSPETAQTLVTLGVDLGRVLTVADLQRGIEEAERATGYRMSRHTPGSLSEERREEK